MGLRSVPHDAAPQAHAAGMAAKIKADYIEERRNASLRRTSTSLVIHGASTSTSAASSPPATTRQAGQPKQTQNKQNNGPVAPTVLQPQNCTSAGPCG